MSELVVVAFDRPAGADEALEQLRRLQKEYLIDLEDAVVAVRQPDGQVRLKQSVNLTGLGAASGVLWGGLWGSLVGMLFLNPLAGFALGSVVGAGTGALSGQLSDYGIDDGFIREVAASIPPDSSALFVLVRKAQPDKVLAHLSSFPGKVLRSSLAPEKEARLQQALSGRLHTPQPVDLASESVAGEEDPGAGVNVPPDPMSAPSSDDPVRAEPAGTAGPPSDPARR